MTVTRYEVTHCHCDAEMSVNNDGTYVNYSDYQKLAAENAALRRIALGYHILTVPEREAPTELEIDAAIAEIKARGVDELISLLDRMPLNDMSQFDVTSSVVEFAANLRAGRKG